MFDTLEEILSPFHADDHQEVFSEINSTESDPHHVVASSNTDSVNQESFRRLRDGVYLTDKIIDYIIMLEKNMIIHVSYVTREKNYRTYFLVFSSLYYLIIRIHILMKI